MPRKKTEYKTAVIDFETDPFVYGRLPKPFAVEFLSDEITHVIWNNNADACVEELIEFLSSLNEPHMIFAHNGGKFDYHFLHKYIDNPVKIINARIVEATLTFERDDETVYLHHVLRDSFAIIPVPLKAFQKDDIDYNKMEYPAREKHRKEILEYLHTDCASLFKLVSAFVDQFGARLTVGSTAMTELKKFTSFSTLTQDGDAVFRRFYYGGRVQCFRSGVLDGPFHGYDINSQYPKAMRDFRHPINCQYDVVDTLPDDYSHPFFLHFTGRNYGALPARDEDNDGALTFQQETGEFFACSHELEIADKYGLVEIDDIISCYVALETTQFKEYVDYWYNQKVTCKKNGDKIGELWAKFMLNSAYGKFGQNPENFSDWLIWRNYGNEFEIEDKGYNPVCEFPDFELWKRPARINDSAFYDVGIAASITSAARSMLLTGIQQSVDPVYCDTDSLICREFRGEISDTVLGAWKHEFTAPKLVIAGKKMYMPYDPNLPWNYRGISKSAPDRAMNAKPYDPTKPENPIKIVSKGGNLTPDQILRMASGETVEYANPAPTFSLVRPARFVTRNFSMTAETGLTDDTD